MPKYLFSVYCYTAIVQERKDDFLLVCILIYEQEHHLITGRKVLYTIPDSHCFSILVQVLVHCLWLWGKGYAHSSALVEVIFGRGERSEINLIPW